MTPTLNASVSPPLSRPSSPVPDFVHTLDFGALGSLAEHARHTTQIDASSEMDVPKQIISCSIDPIPVCGGSNVVFTLAFADGVKWVCRIPSAEWSTSLEERLRLNAMAMQLISTRTRIPVPTLYLFDSTCRNRLGRPYMLLSFVEGTQLSQLWFDPTWFTQENRLHFWRSLTQAMSHLQQFEFSTIGELDYNPAGREYFIRSLYPSQSALEHDGKTSADAVGPFSNSDEWLLHGVDAGIMQEEDDCRQLALLRLFVRILPDRELSKPPFYLQHPDFNYQNIYIDEKGTVTGNIDWDGLSTCPR
jgi:aminoglycoside phosphotransferase (APT) family kinase protein